MIKQTNKLGQVTSVTLFIKKTTRQIWCLTHSRCSFNFNLFFLNIHQVNFYKTPTFTEITLTVWTNALQNAPYTTIPVSEQFLDKGIFFPHNREKGTLKL